MREIFLLILSQSNIFCWWYNQDISNSVTKLCNRTCDKHSCNENIVGLIENLLWNGYRIKDLTNYLRHESNEYLFRSDEMCNTRTHNSYEFTTDLLKEISSPFIPIVRPPSFLFKLMPSLVQSFASLSLFSFILQINNISLQFYAYHQLYTYFQFNVLVSFSFSYCRHF